jgi:hypothetical protein
MDLKLPFGQSKGPLDNIELPKVNGADISAAIEVAGERGRELSGDLVAGGSEGLRLLGEFGREIANIGGENLRQLGGDLRNLADDARSLRITRARRGPDVLPGAVLVVGLSAGAAAMYFFDPQQGRRRRALLRDQLVKWTRITRETVDGQIKDLRNRTMGAAHEVRRAVDDEPWAADVHADLPQEAELTPAR